MREAPWSAARRGGLPPCNRGETAVAGATALQGAFGTTIFRAGARTRGSGVRGSSTGLRKTADPNTALRPKAFGRRAGGLRYRKHRHVRCD
jgi:hypothetical protein